MHSWGKVKMGDEKIFFKSIYLLPIYALPQFHIYANTHLRINPAPHLRITLLFILIMINSKRKTPI